MRGRSRGLTGIFAGRPPTPPSNGIGGAGIGFIGPGIPPSNGIGAIGCIGAAGAGAGIGAGWPIGAVVGGYMPAPPNDGGRIAANVLAGLRGCAAGAGTNMVIYPLLR